MKKIFLIMALFSIFGSRSYCQSTFGYALELIPVAVPGLPGLHSYAFGQYDGKWLVVGGRKDGLHARQPFNAFPESQNNTDIYVIDINTQQFWTASVSVLPSGISEQLQSTNMNFYQDSDTLYIIGGYAYSASVQDHITFPNLTSINVPATINAIIEGNSILPFFKQITGENFAVTGGQLGKIDDIFYLVGGQRFDGRYNPMGNPTYTQTYSDQIKKFRISNQGSQLSYSDFSTIVDPIHLRRRDYNLLPQIFTDGTKGYTISSGVFQPDSDLPFLYPVDITSEGYTPITTFNQYLSNYHSAKSCLYDSINNRMHTLFFGGMSLYFYQNGILMQDENVPFVKTISLLTRNSENLLNEFQLPVEMPGYNGASAEFIPNHHLPHYPGEIIKLSEISENDFIIGHIYGGISSPSMNPFTINQTNTTSADPAIYAVKLTNNIPLIVQEINGSNPYSIHIYPNPASSEITFESNTDIPESSYYLITNTTGQIIVKAPLRTIITGTNKYQVKTGLSEFNQTLILTIVIDNKYFISNKVIINNTSQ
ncbi:MAG: hypothetical protein IPN08_07215 [Bacteroidales bacterium]|nr:hypothetical protein [Bacteroidales bacterium]